MRIAHIIMVHKNPAQLQRLIKRLEHPNFDVYIHLDKKIDIADFKYLENRPQVNFINNRVKCNWGGWSFTTAIIRSMKEVLGSPRKYDFINLISAQDYPIYPAEELYHFFEDKEGKNFIYFSEQKSKWFNDALSRYEKYHFTDQSFKGKYLLQWMVNKIVPIRKLPDNMTLYGGSNSSWWTISKDCASYVVDKIDGNVKFNNFFKYSWGSDEFVITSIIMNSHFRDQCVNNNFRYIDWSAGGGHPKTLLMEDLANIKNSKMLFARKFDIKLDSDVLDELDKNTFAD